jgi:hypothetical protein
MSYHPRKISSRVVQPRGAAHHAEFANFLLAQVWGEQHYDNAVVETFFKTLKAELIWRSVWQTRRQVELALFEYINAFYNPRRRHSTLGGKSPLAFESMAA